MADDARFRDADPANPLATDMQMAQPSKLSNEAALRYHKREFRDDASHSSVWRRAAKDSYDFKAGHQWTPTEKAQLNSEMRPEIVFNRALTMIKAVAGFEINSRHEIQFLPRNVEDTAVNEVLTGASKWMGQDCDAEDEESEAFQDTLVCGMGFTENRMDYELERNGKYLEEEISPLEMYWDRKARKKNLVDARRMWRLRSMSLADAMDQFPGYDRLQLDARWAVGLDPEEETKTLEEKRRREENATDNFSEPMEVHIVHAQWWEREAYWLIADPATNKSFELTVPQYEELTKRLAFMAKMTGAPAPTFSAVKLRRRIYKQCFIGNEILGDVEDAPFRDGFSWNCITGELDRNKGTWFGLIQTMKDPAKWSNKWLSQTLHILNSQAKGGIMVEADFAEDQRKFEEGYAKPNAISVVKKGALSNPNGPKFAPKPVADFPQGFFQLLEFAVSSIRDVTGINLELLGQRDMNQPGILEAMRKQAGMTVLATMFDSLRRFRKQVGRTRLFVIQNYISDGRIIRVAGQDGVKAVRLIRDKCLGEYDVIVDDTPTSPNQKEANWAIIGPMLPMFKDQLAQMPELLVTILEYSPLPSRLVELLKALISKPNPQQDQAKQLATAALLARISKDQATADKDKASAGATQATALYDIAMAKHLLGRGDDSGAAPQKDQLDMLHQLAQIGTENAKTENLRAKTAAEHASTAGQHLGNAIDALTPIPHTPPGQPAAA